MSNSESGSSGSMIRDTRNSRQRQRIELIRSQMIADSMFYDSPQQYQANLSDFHEKVNNVLPSGWRLFRRGIWLQATPPIAKVPIHGWKIHVSSILATADKKPPILQRQFTGQVII